MAQYKVPQDVEADDKLIGPFSFRQFVYLLIAGGLIALAVGLFQIFPFLAIIPVPPILLLLTLALPLKKDQPMETYLAALISYYTKPRKRVWVPGQRESTILITAPKIVEEVKTRDLSQEEATHRLSFLADIVDTQGYAIKGASANPMRDDLYAEANSTMDMFDSYQTTNINRVIDQNKEARHAEAIRGMQEAISRNESMQNAEIKGNVITGFREKEVEKKEAEMPKVETTPPAATAPTSPPAMPIPAPAAPAAPVAPEIIMPDPVAESLVKKPEPNIPKPSIMELANNSDFTVATIAKEANRINRKDEGEIFISLH